MIFLKNYIGQSILLKFMPNAFTIGNNIITDGKFYYSYCYFNGDINIIQYDSYLYNIVLRCFTGNVMVDGYNKYLTKNTIYREYYYDNGKSVLVDELTNRSDKNCFKAIEIKTGSLFTLDHDIYVKLDINDLNYDVSFVSNDPLYVCGEDVSKIKNMYDNFGDIEHHVENYKLNRDRKEKLKRISEED